VQDRRVARRYAKALFVTTQAAGSTKTVEADLSTIVNQMDSDAEFRRFMMSPYASRDEKIRILDSIFAGKVAPVTQQLLHIMLEKRREEELSGIHAEFVELRRMSENVAHAQITSAVELDASERSRVVARLEQVLKRQVDPEFNVDPSLVGGIRVKYENFILDGSVHGALERLKEQLKHDVLKQP